MKRIYSQFVSNIDQTAHDRAVRLERRRRHHPYIGMAFGKVG
jgi:hypothetical protein